MIPIFIGYDPREAVAYHVCSNSIVRQVSQPVSLNPLALRNLGFYVEKHTDGSNHFIYSRFLVPHLMEYRGWAIFMDGDMLLRDDITRLWELRDPAKVVMVFKHDYKTRMTEKYLGSKNENHLPQELVKRDAVELRPSGQPRSHAGLRSRRDGRPAASLHLAGRRTDRRTAQSLALAPRRIRRESRGQTPSLPPGYPLVSRICHDAHGGRMAQGGNVDGLLTSTSHPTTVTSS